MMAAECHVIDHGADLQSRIAEYQGKFPEIPEAILVRILSEHGNDLKSCENILEEESRKFLYGSSPTPDILTPPQVSPGARPKITPPGTIGASPPGTTGTSPSDLIRTNSTGSGGSGQSSGRSTPVNQKPTPWVVRKPSAGHSGLAYSEGGYFYPVEAGHHISPTGMQGSQTSPSFPVVTTSGYFTTSTGNVTTPSTRERHSPAIPYTQFTGVTTGIMRNSPSPITACPPFNGDQRVPPIASQYTTMPHRPPAGYSMYYSPINQQAFLVNSQHPDTRFQNSPNNMYGHGGVFVPVSTAPSSQPTSNVLTTSGFVSTPGDLQRHDGLFNPSPSTYIPDDRSPYTQSVNMEMLHVEPNFLTPGTGPQNIPVTSGAQRQTEPYFSSNRFTPVNSAVQPAGQEKAQPVIRDLSEGMLAGDDYLKDCLLSQQIKRFQNLQKEYAVDKERLEILIKDISKLDSDLYNRRYRVAPDPTDDEIKRLAQEITLLKRTIDEISKNIDRIDNGQNFLPPVNPQPNPQHRLAKQKDSQYGRSKSVPSFPAQGGAKTPQLDRVNSEVVSIRELENQASPPEPSLQGWDFVEKKDVQWHCSKCTFLNHASLRTCEMCLSER